MAGKWTQELKDEVIKAYTDGEPTPENSAELLKEIADKTGETPNGIRMVLMQAEVYVKKDPAAGKTTSGSAAKKDGTAVKRVGKDDLIAELRAAIEEKGAEIDEDILVKLTGKAAAYFTTVLKA